MQTIYEVIRVIGNQPIFLTEHLKRMQKSLDHYPGNHQLDLGFIRHEVIDIARTNELADFNIRIEYHLEEEQYAFYPVAGVYPTPDMIHEGVRIVTFSYQRNHPNIKVYDAELRDAMDERKQANQAFDLLYYQEDITSETSKANIFFIQDNHLVTSPDEAVLLGITRMKTLESARDLGIEVEKRSIRVDELADFDGAFLTGTSIHLLPIRQIDGVHYQVPHPLWQALSQQFEQKILDELTEEQV